MVRLSKRQSPTTMVILGITDISILSRLCFVIHVSPFCFCYCKVNADLKGALLPRVCGYN